MLVTHYDRLVLMVGTVPRLARLRILLGLSLVRCLLPDHLSSLVLLLASLPFFCVCFRRPSLLLPLFLLLWTVIERLMVTPTLGPLVVMGNWGVAI